MKYLKYTYLNHLIAIILLLLGSISVVAQPAYDNCDQAREITNLSNECELLRTDNLTYDLMNPSCADSAAMNAWFKFTAEGPALTITVNSFRGPEAFIGIYEVFGQPCDSAAMIELGCGIDTLRLTRPLTVGEEYYFSVSYDTLPSSSMFVCVDNDIANNDPPNDQICNATSISYDSVCVNGLFGFATYDQPGNFCAFAPERSVWYHGTTPNNANGVIITIDDISIDTFYSVHIYELDRNSCMRTPILVYGFCGVGDTQFVYRNLNPNTDYYYMLGTVDERKDSKFKICLEAITPPPGCAVNNTCPNAEVLKVKTDTFATCVVGCNTDASPGPIDTVNSCYNFQFGTVWYKFRSDSFIDHLDVSLHTSDFDDPQIAFYKGDCNNLVRYVCKLEHTRRMEFTIYRLEKNVDYYIAVSNYGEKNGYFEMCLSAYSENGNCNFDGDIEVINTSFGSPLAGPFKGGEEVTFRYRVNRWEPKLCNFLQGIVLARGEAWDRSSFLPNGKPKKVYKEPEAHADGEWKWISDGSVSYNFDNPERGLMKGDSMPVGWYFIRNDVPSIDVDSSLGDGTFCVDTSLLNWEIEFSLKVKPYPVCTLYEGNSALSILFLNYSDAEIGANPHVFCTEDKAASLSVSSECCEGIPMNDLSVTICGGEPYEYEFPQNSLIEKYYWIVESDTGVTGASAGEGQFFSQRLTHFGVGPRTVTYSVYAQDTTGCVGMPGVIEITVYPQVRVDAGLDTVICEDGFYELGGNPTVRGGKPPYIIRWTPDLGEELNPIISPRQSTEYELLIIDTQGCRDKDKVTVDVNPSPNAVFEAEVLYQCPGESLEINIEFTGTPPFHYELYQGPSFLLRDSSTTHSAQYTITATQNSTIRLSELTDSICSSDGFDAVSIVLADTTVGVANLRPCNNEPIVVGDSIITENGNYKIIINDGNQFGCDSIVYVSVSYQRPLLVDTALITADDGNILGKIRLNISGGTPPYSALWSNGMTGLSIDSLMHGVYIVEVRDSRECITLDTFTVPNISSTTLSLYPSADILLSPQPVKSGNLVTFKLINNTDIIQSLEIFNNQGKRVSIKAEQVNNHKTQWQSIEAGIYFYKLSVRNKGVVTGKIIVQ